MGCAKNACLFIKEAKMVITGYCRCGHFLEMRVDVASLVAR